MQSKNNQSKLNHFYPQPVLRTIVLKTSPRRWSGCIFFSSYDLTAEVLLLIQSITGEYKGSFLKNPLLILKAPSKSELEIKMNVHIKSLIKSN
jgi:hypothetical protein